MKGHTGALMWCLGLVYTAWGVGSTQPSAALGVGSTGGGFCFGIAEWGTQTMYIAQKSDG